LDRRRRNALAADYGQAVLVVVDEKQAAHTGSNLSAQLRDDERDRVHVLSPPEFVAHLDSIDERTEDAPEQTIQGYRVNLRHETGTDGEQAAREAIAKVVARSLKRMKDEE
jgi:hypothetical protein